MHVSFCLDLPCDTGELDAGLQNYSYIRAFMQNRKHLNTNL